MAALVASLDDRSVASWANRSKLLLFIGCVVSQGGGGGITEGWGEVWEGWGEVREG